MGDDPFGVLFVCHANVCRSALAERLARATFATRWVTGPRPRVDSAGTHAWAGAAMHPYAEMVLIERGADPAGFGSRPLDAAIVAGASLVLTATREQRARCVTLVPGALGRTFTITQFGRIAHIAATTGRVTGRDAGQRLRGLLADVAPIRALIGYEPPDAHDLDDPVAGPIAAFRVCAARIQTVLDAIVDVISV